MHLIIIGGFLVNHKPIDTLLHQFEATFIDINTLDTKSLSSMSTQITPLVQNIFNTKQRDKVSFIGFSIGGLVAIQLAQIFAPKTAQLILINSSPKFMMDQNWLGITKPNLNNLINRLTRLSLINFAKYFIRLATYPKVITDAEYLTYLNFNHTNAPHNKNIYANLLNIIANTDLRNELYSLTKQMPVTLFYSKHDTLVPVNTLSYADALELQQISLPNSTHLDIMADISYILNKSRFHQTNRQLNFKLKPVPSQNIATNYLKHSHIQQIAAHKIHYHLTKEDANSGTPMILDLGSGPGTLTNIKTNINNNNIILCDLNLSMLKSASQNKFKVDSRFINADAHCLPFANNSFDIIIANLMIQWSVQKDIIIKEIRRTLKPDGKIIFTTLIDKSLWQIQQAWNKVLGSNHKRTLKFENMQFYQQICAQNYLEITHEETWEHIAYFNTTLELMYHFKNTGTSIPLSQNSGLGGKRRLQQFIEVYEDMRTSKGLPLSYHYGLFILSPEKE